MWVYIKKIEFKLVISQMLCFVTHVDPASSLIPHKLRQQSSNKKKALLLENVLRLYYLLMLPTRLIDLNSL